MKALFATAVLLVSACSSTRVINHWSDPAVTQGEKLSKVLIVGVSPDPAIRRQYEQVMAEQMKQRGAVPVQSYSVMGTDKPDKAQVEQAVKAGDYDAVLVTRFAGRHEETSVVSDSMAPGMMYPGGMYGFWAVGYDQYRLDVDEYVEVETRLYRTDGPEPALAWSARTETREPSDAGAVIKGAAESVAKKMQDDGLF